MIKSNLFLIFENKLLLIIWKCFFNGFNTEGFISLTKIFSKFKFLQVLYLKPLSDDIRKEIEKAKNVIIVEGNSTGQLGRLIREKTGIKIEKRILKYNTRPFTSDELGEEIKRKLK